MRLVTAGWYAVTARAVLATADPDVGLGRQALQTLGARLEDERPGRWLMEAAAAAPRPAVVDAARTQAQVAAARELLHDCLVVHLDAPLVLRRSRFASRGDAADEGIAFDALRSSPIELEAERLGRLADLVIDARAHPKALLDLVLQTANERVRNAGG